MKKSHTKSAEENAGVGKEENARIKIGTEKRKRRKRKKRKKREKRTKKENGEGRRKKHRKYVRSC